VVELREQLGLALEAGQAPAVVGESRRQELQRHVAVEAGVVGAPHLAHAARAEFFGHLVVAQGLAEHGGSVSQKQIPSAP